MLKQPKISKFLQPIASVPPLPPKQWVPDDVPGGYLAPALPGDVSSEVSSPPPTPSSQCSSSLLGTNIVDEGSSNLYINAMSVHAFHPNSLLGAERQGIG
jgi:hypothetical protein